MLKRRILVVFLVVLLVGAFVGLAEGKTDEELKYEMVDLWEEAHITLDNYTQDKISYSTVVSDFQDYAGTARFIYKDAFENSDNRDFVKSAAVTTVVLDLYAEGFQEMDLEKVKLANLILDEVLLSQFEDMSR